MGDPHKIAIVQLFFQHLFSAYINDGEGQWVGCGRVDNIDNFIIQCWVFSEYRISKFFNALLKFKRYSFTNLSVYRTSPLSVIL